MSYDSVLAGLGVVGDWKLDDASGTVAAATVGSNGTYAAAGGITYSQAGLLNDGGTSVLFDGNTAEVVVPTTGILGTAGAVAFWCKTADAVMCRDSVTSTAGWLVASNGASLSTRANVNTSRASPVASSAVNDNVRHLFVLTTDGTTVTLYMDGVQVDQYTQAAAFSTIHSPLRFGRSGTNTGTTNFYAGGYDRITLFNANLSPTDVADMWAAGIATVTATGAHTAGATATGVVGKSATATGAHTSGATAAGVADAAATATGAHTAGASASGTVVAGLSGDATGAHTAGGTAGGVVAGERDATGAHTAGATADGAAGKSATATGAHTSGATAAGALGRVASATGAHTSGATADGTVGTGGGGGTTIQLADGTTLTVVGYADGSKTLTVLGWLDADGTTIHPFT